MHILHLVSSMNWGGLEYRAMEQVEWLNANGHRSSLGAHPESELYKRAVKKQIPILALPFRGSFSPVVISRLWNFIRQEKVDLVDCHDRRDNDAAALCRFLCPVVRSHHMVKPMKDSFRHRMRWQTGCDAVIATAEIIKKQLTDLSYKDADKIHVVGEWADEPFFLPATDERQYLRNEFDVTENTRLFAVIGMLRRDKGQDIFIETAKQYLEEDPNALFLIIGEATQSDTSGFKGELIASIKKYDLTNRVIMCGYRSDIPRVTKALDALIICSTGTEAQSRTAPQAFASKVPLVASKVGGVPELVTHEETGLLVDIGDVNAYTQALHQLIEDQEFAQQLTQNAYTFSKQELTLKHRMLETLDVYSSVMTKRG